MSEKKWRALDHCSGCNGDDNEISQDADQFVSNEQKSYEWIIVKDSEFVDVQSTDTQAAVSLQLAIQAAITAVISITIGDTNQGKSVAQDIFQFIKTKQKNNQKTIVLGSKNVQVTTTDTDLAVNIQALLQILVAIVVKLDVL